MECAKIHHNSFLLCWVGAWRARARAPKHLIQQEQKRWKIHLLSLSSPFWHMWKNLYIFCEWKTYLIHLCRHEYVLDFSQENREKQTWVKVTGKPKWSVQQKWSESERKKSEWASDSAGNNSTILWYQIHLICSRLLLHIALFFLPVCCYLVENFRRAPPTTWIKGKCWKRYSPVFYFNFFPFFFFFYWNDR